jgi:hypothetical protein
MIGWSQSVFGFKFEGQYNNKYWIFREAVRSEMNFRLKDSFELHVLTNKVGYQWLD